MRLNFITSARFSIIRLILLCLPFGYIQQKTWAQCPANPVLSITASDRNGTQGSWTVPAGGPYKIKITAKGAKGGNDYFTANQGGNGATMIGDFVVNSGDVLEAIAGGQGQTNIGFELDAGAGGAGSAVRIGNTLLIVAGGGGGGAPQGNGSPGSVAINGSDGGSGSYGGNTYPGGSGGTNGNAGNGSAIASGGGGAFSGAATVTDAVRVTTGGGAGFGGIGGNSNGYNYGGTGFGGGGASPRTTLGANSGGGGGGGYSGGGGGGSFGGAGGGGGSYNTGTNQNNTGGANAGHGQVIIECLGALCTDARCSDSLELVKLYNATDGANWTNKWDLTKPMDTWYTCSALSPVIVNGRVTNICLENNQLNGTIPDLNLPKLEELILADYQLTGTIPDFNLPELQTLFITNTQVNGSIPAFNNLPKLEQLALGINQLSGPIPDFNLPRLKSLQLAGNQLSGTIPDFNLPELTTMELDANSLTGSIPDFDLPKLQYLSLTSNQLTGSVPDFNLPSLLSLNATLNQLSGILPGFANLGNLTNLHLGFNQLTGSIPNYNLSNLYLIQLNNNQLSGSVPAFNLPKLSGLYLNNNQLTGSIPSFSLPKLQGLDLNTNQLTGTIPNFNMPELTDLRLYENQLTGAIPNFNMPFLQNLQLHSNQLTGSIPAFNLPYLQSLLLNNNQLTGCIPAAIKVNSPFVQFGGDISNNPGLATQSWSDYWDNGSGVCPVCPGGNIVYVNVNAGGANNGTSWADAFTDLQDALALANSCSDVNQIWVAAGTYKPTTGTDRTVSFVMKNGLAIYGGFAGGETQLSQRNWSTNVTILSGDLSGDDVVSGNGATLSITNNGENSIHVIFNYNNGLDGTAVLDGFTIKGGNADDISLFPNYVGGGMINRNSSPMVTNCIFSGNSNRNAGGGMYNLLSSPTITNCSFLENSSVPSDGGGMYNATSSPILTNCSFSGNSADRYGGGIYNTSSSSSTLTNCIIWGNSSGIANEVPGLTITYSIVQGGYSGTGNLNTDPLFVNAATGDLRLQACSPAIDAGSDAANITTTGLDGNSRKVDAISGGSQIDMGAYEFQGDLDADNDSYSNCNNQDCNDNDATVNPGATEICDGIDNNCNGTIDEGFANTDGDALANCVDPDDDNDGTPDATDCAQLDATKWRTGNFYIDGDGDGYGSGSPVSLCYGATTPTGYSTIGGDCNDGNPNIKPGAVEICGNGIDDNCNGQVDENCSCVNVIVSTGTISCYGGLTTITVYASGGKAPYKYKLSGGFNFQLLNYFIVGAGTYSVTVMDKTGCTKTISNIVVTQPAPLTLTLVQKTDVSCRNGTNGKIIVSAGGGTGPYSYKLNSGSYGSSGTFQNLRAGIYTVTARDAKGCYKSMSITIKNGSGSCSSFASSIKSTNILLDARLSPNPAKTEFTLQVSGNSAEAVHLRVTDLYGKLLYSTKGGANHSYKFGHSFATGVYVIEVMQGEYRKTIKAVKE